MKTDIICGVPVTAGEFTIVTAEYAGDVMKHCCQTAQAARKAGAGVLVINTGLSKRRFKEAAQTAGIEIQESRDSNYLLSPGRAPIIIQTTLAGELSSNLTGVAQICKEAKIRIVVLSGWEWTSSNYGRKERLLCGLRQLLDELDIAMVVYSQSPGMVKAGKYGRGAVGKLAMMAYEVVELGEEMMNDEFVNDESRGDEMELGEAVVAPKPLPVVAGGEQLSVRKIKELETVSADGGGVNQLGVNHPPAPLLQKAGEYAVAA